MVQVVCYFKIKHDLYISNITYVQPMRIAWASHMMLLLGQRLNMKKTEVLLKQPDVDFIEVYSATFTV